jgi:WD40 repeat protein
LPDRKLLRTLQGHTDSVFSVAFSPDGQTLVSGSLDKTIKIWNTTTGNLQNTVTVRDRVQIFAITRDVNTLAFASSSAFTVQLGDLRNRRLFSTVSRHSQSVRLVIFSDDGKILIVGSKDQGIKIWRLTSP